jgi:hypothetical protein
MPINPDKNVLKNIVFLKQVAAEIQKLADENHRSFSSQVAYMCDQYLKIKQQ